MVKSSIDLRPSTTSSERYFRPIILESSLTDASESLKRNPLVQMPCQHPSQPSSSILSTISSSSQGELSSAFTYVPPTKQTKKFSLHPNHHFADQSSSSADSGVHSSYTQSPITKHSFRKYVFLFIILLNSFDIVAFLDVNYMVLHLIDPCPSMAMMIKRNISMRLMINIQHFYDENQHRIEHISKNNIP